ncbi:AAA domain containing protein [uncultured Caudovirales phage]|uniref:AAA domain containing protein n=1 Tax=uncultured Caudovirales phage TaxID=2100421 RepID=A0A6J5NK46_9CAUD|nr:AAA domain containing protein [uncultured Caudovirales phage]
MSFKPMNTADATTAFRKTLLFAQPGWGKTTQAKHFKAHYGKGFIISGESGLSSIRSAGIDYLPFTSFDGPVDPANGVWSFLAICRAMQTPEFKAAGYKWIMLDSLTELGDVIMTWASAKAERDAAEAGKKVNGFAKYGDYGDKMIGACKWVRDLPYHVIIASLAAETENEDTGVKSIEPLVHGSKAKVQIPGIFDNVFGGVIQTTKATKEAPAETKRFIVTGNYGGFKAKVRDESGAAALVEETGNVCDVLRKIEAAEAAAIASSGVKK